MMTPDEANLAARRHFARTGVRCIRAAINGEDRVNDLTSYVAWRREGIRAALKGDGDHTFTHRQMAHYLQTGECVPLFTRKDAV
jgi:hypothetical protein